jgi:hypothetical protein
MIQLNNAALINHLQKILLPCEQQWAESIRMAQEMLSLQEAQSTEALIRAALEEAGEVPTGNLFAKDAGCVVDGRVVTIGEMMAVVGTGQVVDHFSETPNPLFASEFTTVNGASVAVNPPKPKVFLLRCVQTIGK